MQLVLLMKKESKLNSSTLIIDVNKNEVKIKEIIFLLIKIRLSKEN